MIKRIRDGLGVDANQPRAIQALAALAIVLIATGTVLAVAYAAIIKGDQAATTLLGTLATGSLGALIVIAGGRNSGGDNS